jgi:flagellin-specific chaperone FliS
MDPRDVYRQPYSPGWTRADMLLALFDGAIERLDLASAAFRCGDRMAAVRLLTRAEMIVFELVSGVDREYVHAAEFLRLYGIVSRAIGAVTLEHTEGAVRLLRAMRGGLATLREEAVRLEREGLLPCAAATHIEQATA